MLSAGTIVFSKAGRDKGRAMAVIRSEGEFLFLSDGDTRPLARLKKKKLKHVQTTKTQINLQPECGRDLQDADIRKQLTFFNQHREGGNVHCLKTT